MDFYSWRLGEPLKANAYGIFEPEVRDVSLVLPDMNSLFLVPVVAVDKLGQRIGSGAGFYDRYFAQNPFGVKIGVAFDFQVMKNLPRAKNDVKVDYIASDKNIIKV